MKPHISVIIPALNEEKLLPRLLKEITSQTYRNFEVILVDADSTDKTIAIAKKFSKDFSLKIVHTKEKNISKSRNIGAEHASGQYYFFIDADNYIYPQFLEKMEKVLREGYQMIIPAVRPDSGKMLYAFLYNLVNFLVGTAMACRMPFSTGGNFIIEKNVFKKIRGFDETIFVGEDHDIVGKAHRLNVKIAFVKHPKVVFSVRRFEKEGVAVFAKYFVSTVYIALFGKITKKIYNYQMGGGLLQKEVNLFLKQGWLPCSVNL